MNDLTEQWDKGKLPSGDYYIKIRNGEVFYDNIDYDGVWRNSLDEDIVEVLAPVPSYDEWQAKLEENEILRKRLEIATKGLKNIKHKIDDFEDDPMNKIEFMAYSNLWSVRDMSKEVLKQIKELDK